MLWQRRSGRLSRNLLFQLPFLVRVQLAFLGWSVCGDGATAAAAAAAA
eukprot:CAMPEP_0198288964 /NCGR_PEP_ID=MMETSP1449-20131203/7315_1 /TAXON_ID=420275 /ORGANISM="Attheya septentrionalis, Strain CCMP2084" /LENGTH=47 /DNA_ID= /DNA_START= /DNA_END= /DNA_ORIENTATION=